jgi:hypothetical protein
LVNACLNDSDKIKTLYKNLEGLNLKVFEKALCNVIDFVNDSIAIIIKFKGNTRTSNKVFHSKYQVLSMISTTFKEMYISGNYSGVADNWAEKKHKVAKNLVQYYVYDIINKYWFEGGTSKIHSAAKPNRYLTEISSRAWMVALDSFFECSMLRTELKKISNPGNEEYVVLNCIYLKTFTAMDQLSLEKFDIEHIAPKEQMRRMIQSCNGDGLPISCIANLCYLPEYVNRSKKDKNFYQDKKYLMNINIAEVESKYSFTESEDMEWMDMPYEQPEDFVVLKEYYTDYCTKRFDKIKHMFCESLSIQYEEIEHEEQVDQKIVIPIERASRTKKVKFADKCIQRLVGYFKKNLIKVGRSTYITDDNLEGFAVTTSKVYKQGNREKFWFAYRRNPVEDIVKCSHKYILYGCKDESTIIKIPVNEIESRIDSLNNSKDEDGNISHWHMVFFRDNNGKMTWMLSKPEIMEIDVTHLVIQDCEV